MDINYYVFRKTSFGGFNRKDVIDYIESIKNEYADYKSKAEKEISELRARIEELESGAYQKEAIAEETFQETEATEETCEEIQEPEAQQEQEQQPQHSVIDSLCLNTQGKETPEANESALGSGGMERLYETIKNFSFDYQNEEKKESKGEEASVLDSITTFIF